MPRLFFCEISTCKTDAANIKIFGGLLFRCLTILMLCLSLFQITPGGKASSKGIYAGDNLMAINGQSTEGMTHLEAQNAIKRSQTLKLNLNR